MNAHRFKVRYNGVEIGAAASPWDANRLAVAYMREHHVSPVAIWDSESTQAPEFQTSHMHIEAYEGPPEIVAARMALRAHESAKGSPA